MLPSLPDSPLVVGHVLDLIGDTPLVELRRMGRSPAGQPSGQPGGRASGQPSGEPVGRGRGRVLAKCEQLSPGGSVKDRIALAMVEQAERQGLLKPGGVVVEPTSGNTGIGLALVCASKGYRCVLTMPASMSLERRQLLEAFGARVVLTDAERQMEGAIERARQIALETPGAWLPSQFDNPANPAIHAETTARELLAALGEGRIDAFVAAVGTGGTVSGVGRVLKAARPGVKIIAVEPEACATISRGERGPTKIQGIAAGFVPGNYDPSVVDAVRTVTDRAAYDTKQALAHTEGLLVGISAGANVFVALELARELGPESTVVTMLCDTGERYFSLDEFFAA